MLGVYKQRHKKAGHNPDWFILQSRKDSAFVFVHSFDGIDMVWGYGPSYCPYDPEEYRVIWYYGRLSLSSMEEVEPNPYFLIDLNTSVDRYAGELREGFISPSGEYFVFKYGEHTYAASRIVAQYYPEMWGDDNDDERTLEDLGYIYVRFRLSTCPDHELTESQQKRIDQLLIGVAEDNGFADGLRSLRIHHKTFNRNREGI